MRNSIGRHSLVAIAAAAVMVLGLGSGAGASTASIERSLKTQVLTAAILGSGWTQEGAVVAEYHRTTHAPTCAGRVAGFNGPEATATFVQKNDIPALEETLSKPTAGKHGYKSFVSALNHCRSFSISDGGSAVTHIKLKVAPISVGGPASGYIGSLSDTGGTKFTIDIVVAYRKGLLIDLSYVDSGQVPIGTLKPFVLEALAQVH